MFIQDNRWLLWTSTDIIKENGFTLEKKKSRSKYNKCWQHRWSSATPKYACPMPNPCCIARGIGLNVNANKTELMCFKKGAISTLIVKPLKLVNQFTYLGSKISSTESDTLSKVWTAIDELYGNVISRLNKTEFLPTFHFLLFAPYGLLTVTSITKKLFFGLDGMISLYGKVPDYLFFPIFYNFWIVLVIY